MLKRLIMKKNSLSVLLVILFLFNQGCKKDNSGGLFSHNTAPIVDAGNDIYQIFPITDTILSGKFKDAESNADTYLWKQVYGLVGAVIETPNSITTKLSNLQIGKYDFELTIFDTGKLWDKDTVSVFVQDPSFPGQRIVMIPGKIWVCPMGCSMTINCFYCIIPMNTPFKIYLQEGSGTPWIEVISITQAKESDKYIYDIDMNNLSIYSNNDIVVNSSVIKIVY